MTGDGTYIYIYNALNQLTQVKRASDNAVIATYTYNHNGLRKSKTVNGVTTTYNWDASGNLVRETTSGASTYFYWVGTKLVGLKKNSTTYIVHDNLRGDVETITDVNGNIVAQAHYDPWGNSVASSGSLVQPMRYAGYYYDDETGLYYLKSRYYSPALGRFLTRDGIGFIKHTDPQTLNLYSYCKNNPVSLTDPDGNWASDAERNLAELIMDPYDFGRLDSLSGQYGTASEARQLEINKEANDIRIQYNLQPFGPTASSYQSVVVTETECWTDAYYLIGDRPALLPNGEFYSNYQSWESETIASNMENQIYRWVPSNYIRIGERFGEVESSYPYINGAAILMDYRQPHYYDYGPQR